MQILITPRFEIPAHTWTLTEYFGAGLKFLSFPICPSNIIEGILVRHCLPCKLLMFLFFFMFWDHRVSSCSNYNPLQLQPERMESAHRTCSQLSSDFQRQSVCRSAPPSIYKLHFLWRSLMAAMALSLHPREDAVTLCRCHPVQTLVWCTQESFLAATDGRFFHGHTCTVGEA